MRQEIGHPGHEELAPSYRDCWRAARDVRSTVRGRAARRHAQPRNAVGMSSGGPLFLFLRVAARRGALVWLGPESFAVIREPDRSRRRALGCRGRVEAALSDEWEAFLGVVAFVAAFVVAIPLAIAGAPDLGYIVVVVTGIALVVAALGTGTKDAVSSFRLRRQVFEEFAVDQLSRRHRCVVLAHASSPTHATDIRRALSTVGTARVPTALRRPRQPATLVLPVVASTSEDLLREAAAVPFSSRVARGSVIILRSRRTQPMAAGDEKITMERIRRLVGTAVSMLVAVSVAIVVFALPVAQNESAACRPGPCEGVPARYGDAVYWLTSRVLGGDPDGLGANTGIARFVGLGFSVTGVLLLAGVIARAAAVLVTILEGQGEALARQVDSVRARGRARIALRRGPVANRKWAPRRTDRPRVNAIG